LKESQPKNFNAGSELLFEAGGRKPGIAKRLPAETWLKDRHVLLLEKLPAMTEYRLQQGPRTKVFDPLFSKKWGLQVFQEKKALKNI